MTYLRNVWYLAALSTEVADKPLARTLLDEKVVLFRTGDGSVAALADRCPHRFVPLSRGRVVDGDLECTYHGLRFGRNGACTHNPHGDCSLPRGADIRSYPVHERDGFVWYWPGDPARADISTVPVYEFLSSPDRFRGVYGRLPVKANYELVIDNLLDLSHVEFLHPLFKQPNGVAAHRTEFRQDGNVVIAKRWKPDVPVFGLMAMFWKDESKSERFDARAHMRWSPPSVLHFDLGATEVGGDEPAGLCLPNAHVVTPETRFSAHYFWAIARNRKLDDEAISERLYTVANGIFGNEDLPIIEAQQEAMGDTADLMSLHPLTLSPDAPALRARLILARLIKEEQTLAPSATMAAE